MLPIAFIILERPRPRIVSDFLVSRSKIERNKGGDGKQRSGTSHAAWEDLVFTTPKEILDQCVQITPHLLSFEEYWLTVIDELQDPRLTF